MVIFAWLILATFMLLGFIFLSVMSVGVFVSLIVIPSGSRSALWICGLEGNISGVASFPDLEVTS